MEFIDGWLDIVANRLENKYDIERKIGKTEQYLSKNIGMVWKAGWVVLALSILALILIF